MCSSTFDREQYLIKLPTAEIQEISTPRKIKLQPIGTKPNPGSCKIPVSSSTHDPIKANIEKQTIARSNIASAAFHEKSTFNRFFIIRFRNWII